MRNEIRSLHDEREGSAPFRGVVRALSVLRALNDRNRSTVSELSACTGIPRPSLYRVLETLRATGYVRKRADNDRYELTALVRALSHGFNDEAWVCEIVAPVLADLQREIVWPTDTATFFDDAMYLRETTRPRSPLTIDRATVGLRLPMLLSATGKAYLAFCGEAERAAILARLARSESPEDAVARDPRIVRRILAQTRRNGYGQRSGNGFMPETSSIAIPVCVGERVMACLNITFITAVLTPQAAAARYLASLRAAARGIERELKRSTPA